METLLACQQFGHYLVKNTVISTEKLACLLKEQQRSHCTLEALLIGQNDLSYYALYQHKAAFLGIPFVDLTKTPCDLNLLQEEQLIEYRELHIAPWKKEGDTYLLAVCDITPEIRRWAKTHYGINIRYVLTSPNDIRWMLESAFKEAHTDAACNNLWRNTPIHSARTLFTTNKVLLNLYVICLILVTLHVAGGADSITFLLLMQGFYFFTMVFKALLFFLGYYIQRHTIDYTKEAHELSEAELPVYTILVPLFKEGKETLTQLTEALYKLDYPKAKLDIKLIVEEGDQQTIAILKSLQCPPNFIIIRVPYSLPQTKPKACNYAMQFAKGSLVTIYDAEDMPDPLQLRKVVAAFCHLPKEVVCIQARLNYFNREENLLSRMFAIEYSMWFDFMLLGLEKLSIPIPLGGTSNHFKTAILQALHCWDPYNVTEDADLGIRLAAQGYRTTVIDSLTLEEAPLSLGAWLNQRARWIKGYMQTYLVHMRNPVKLYRTLDFRGFFGMQLFIGAPCVLFLISPALWIFFPVLLHFNQTSTPLLTFAIHTLCYANLLLGLVLPVIFTFFVGFRHKWWEIMGYGFIFPFYWLLHSLASFKAFFQLIFYPHHWDKTPHGLTSYKPEP